MQDLDNCLLLDNSRASSNCPCLNGNLAAIDFETANNERSSVCSVGVVIVSKIIFIFAISMLAESPQVLTICNFGEV